MIPIKKSNQWIGVFVFYTIIVFVGLLVTRILLGSDLIGNYLFGLILISLGSALIPCIGGYFGKWIFFVIVTLSVMIGMLYTFYVVLGNTASGWDDLTSIIGYLFIVAIGIFFALFVEVLLIIVRLRNK